MARLDHGYAAALLIALLWAGTGTAQTFFTEVTDQAFSGRPFGARSTAWGDFDNDGWPDLFLSENFGSRIALWQNQGNGRFADLALVIGGDIAEGVLKGGGAAFGDYDNDGDLDLYVPVGDSEERYRDLLLRNDQGFFHEVGLAAGLADRLPTDNALWLDYDRDGNLDLYTGHMFPSDMRNRLYRSQGDGTFRDVTTAAGLALQLSADGGGSNGGMAAGDFDDDGWPDLYVGVLSGPNRLFLNDGQGQFRDATAGDLADSLGGAFGVAVGDIDNDGNFDLFQAAGGVTANDRCLLLLNLGNGQFLDIADGAGLSALGNAALGAGFLGAGLGDIDNDGDLDLMVGNPFFLFLNNGDATFTDQTARSGIDGAALTVSFADWNLDGSLDVAFGKRTLDEGAARLYRNNGNSNHWLRVELVGTRSNRSGIGARLVAVAGDLTQTRQILGGRGFEQDELVAHFGLGQRTQVDRLEIRWLSGQIDSLTDLPADQKIRIVEGQGRYHPALGASWTKPPAFDSLTAGTTVSMDVLVRLPLFEDESRITSVVADLSQLGGSAAMPVVPAGDGTWPLAATLHAPRDPGYRSISLMVEQATSLGPYWSRMSRQFTILPANDLLIYGDRLAPGWSLRKGGKVTPDTQATAEVFQGRTAIAAQTSGLWSLTFSAAEPAERLGYAALRFAFHPGDASGDTLHLALATMRTSLWPGKEGQAKVDLTARTWQVIEIPLGEIQPEQLVRSITLGGNLSGTIYLDDLRLVAARPSSQPGTAVTETRGTALPQAFSLAQNYPNPFNSATVIQYALPQADQVDLAIYNLAGQRVAVLAHGVREAGSYSLAWDGRDDAGRAMASGVYLYRLTTGPQGETQKLLLLR